MSKRKLDNWLLTYMDWVLPRTDAQESFLYLSGLFCLAAAVRRRVCITEKYLGNWVCNPYLYIMFIGPPGTRKTTAISQANKLLDELEKSKIITRAPDEVSAASLVNLLVNTEDAAIFITSHEFGEFVAKSQEGMYTTLTAFFDGKTQHSGSTLSRGAEFVESPCINMITGTTDIWIKENMTEEVIGGGFASRVLMMYETGPRRKKLLYNDVVNLPEIMKLKEPLIHDLKLISGLKGEFEMTKDAQDWLVDWNEKLVPPSQRYLQGYHQRKPKHLMSMAMLHRIAYSDELILDVPDFTMALAALMQVEGKLASVFQNLGKNPYVFTVRDMLGYIVRKGKVSKPDLIQEFQASMPAEKIEVHINQLMEMKKIKEGFDQEKKLIMYEPREK